MKKHTALSAYNRIHFIGIGGVSMSGLAETLARDGFIISGSDRDDSAATSRLKAAGITINIGTVAENITPDMDLVVYNAAIKPDNPERMAAVTMGIPTIVRGELLGLILQAYKYPVCVAGSHGKTSTTALITAIALHAGLDPTVNVGGYIGGTNYFIGDSPYFILEACEYTNSFHHWHPHIGVILNIDADHMDFYGSMDAIIDAFAKFARNIRPGGTLVIQDNVPGFDRIVEGLTCKIVTFGSDETVNGYWAKELFPKSSKPNIQSFEVMHGSESLARVDLPLPGKYNMYNAVAAFAMARELYLEPDIIAAGLSGSQGVKRRYEHKGQYNGAIIIDDYAHHPTEIKACLAAARDAYPTRRIICLFQPHTYTRTRDLFEDFTQAFGQADINMFVPIFAAREPHDPTISSKMLADAVKDAENCNSLEEAEEILRGKLLPNDLLITMGAGDVYLVGDRILSS